MGREGERNGPWHVWAFGHGSDQPLATYGLCNRNYTLVLNLYKIYDYCVVNN